MPVLFVGYQSARLGSSAGNGPWPCLQVAGPQSRARHPRVPAPTRRDQRPDGRRGRLCMSAGATEVQLGWPPFPDAADLFVRTGAGGGAGVCDNCVDAGKRWVVVTGFVTQRVVRLEVHLEDGSVHNVPVETWPNDAGVGAFVFFPPSAQLIGDVLAYDADGRLLARASLCGPADGRAGCDVAPTQQIVPGANTSGGGTPTEPPHGLLVTYPNDWMPASQILTPTLTDPREIFAVGTYPLRPGGTNCAQYPVNAIEDLGPSDALIWLAERQHVSASVPNRPTDFEAWMSNGLGG